jgi:hypothetical protein
MSEPDSVAPDVGGPGPAELLLAEIVNGFRAQKRAGDAALAQLADEDWQRRLDAESNSIAVLVRHLDGNMRSRWSEFLASDGEKPTRQRDAEFEDADLAPDELRRLWERGWSTVFAAIEPLTPADLTRVVTIRGEPHSVARALLRQLTHYAQHVGQIVLLAKHLRGPSWRTLSIPRRRSPSA